MVAISVWISWRFAHIGSTSPLVLRRGSWVYIRRILRPFLHITEERYAPLIHAGVLDGRKILLAYRCVLAYIAGGLDINRGAANISRPTISRRPVSGAPIQYALKYTAAPTKCLLFSSAWRHTFTPKSEFARAGDGARDRRVGTELFAGGQEET